MEMKRIESRANPFVRELSKLKMKKYRDEARLFLFEGEKLFSEALSSSLPLRHILVSESYYETHRAAVDGAVDIASANAPGLSVFLLSDAAYEKICEERAPQGILCVAPYIDKFEKRYIIDVKSSRPFSALLLDNIRDPGNLGTVIRSAAAFGVDQLILSRGCADVYGEKTVRGSMGALFRQNILINADLAAEIRFLRGQGKKVYAAALHRDAVSIGDADLCGACVVIGNEGQGIDASLIEQCSGTVLIPMEAGAESLNAAVAASLFAWEMRRANAK